MTARRPIRIGAPVAAAVVLAAGWLALRITETPFRASAANEPSAPTTLAGVWTGTVLPNDPRSLSLLETDDVTLMEYRLGQEPPVWLVRVGGFGTRAAFHPPELCYVGSDFEVLERGPITVLVNGGARRIMRLVVAQKGERREAWYWFTAAGRTTPSYLTQQFWLVADALRRLPSAGTLVHISSPMEDPRAVSRRLLAFVAALDRDSGFQQFASVHAPAPDAL
jgi:EpsI family protein